MKCPVCDGAVTSGGSFCPQCGAKLPATAAPMPQSAPPRAPAAAPSAPVGAPTAGRHRSIVDVAEETLWEGTFSPRAMIGTAAIAGLVSIGLIVGAVLAPNGWLQIALLAGVAIAWLLVGLRLAIRRLGVSYKLTNHMFYHRHGILTHVTDRIELIEIHDVTYERSLFDRLVNTGKIKIASNDRTDPIFYLHGIEHVEKVAQLIDKARRGEQVRRGRRIDFSQIDGAT